MMLNRYNMNDRILQYIRNVINIETFVGHKYTLNKNIQKILYIDEMN